MWLDPRPIICPLAKKIFYHYRVLLLYAVPIWSRISTGSILSKSGLGGKFINSSQFDITALMSPIFWQIRETRISWTRKLKP